MTNKETIEDAFNKTWIGKHVDFNSDIGAAFQLGAQHQAITMYSEEEVISLLDFVNDRLPDLHSRFNPEEELEEWFNQFKQTKQ